MTSPCLRLESFKMLSIEVKALRNSRKREDFNSLGNKNDTSDIIDLFQIERETATSVTLSYRRQVPTTGNGRCFFGFVHWATQSTCLNKRNQTFMNLYYLWSNLETQTTPLPPAAYTAHGELEFPFKRFTSKWHILVFVVTSTCVQQTFQQLLIPEQRWERKKKEGKVVLSN